MNKKRFYRNTFQVDSLLELVTECLPSFGDSDSEENNDESENVNNEAEDDSTMDTAGD